MDVPSGRLRRALFPLALFLAVGIFLILPKAQGFFFRDGDDPVVFFGDNVTKDGGYPVLIETYLLTRFPNWRLSFRNLGADGDTAWLRRRGGLEAAVARDIRALRPRAAAVSFGLNDARGGAERELPRYSEALAGLVSALRAAGSRVVVLTPTPEEGTHPDAPGGSEFNFGLNKFVLEAEQVAARAGVPSVDLFTPLLRAIEVAQVSAVDARLIPDGVHPGPAGHWVIAARILKSLGAPGLVSHAAIDFKERRVTAGQGCSVEIDRAAPPPELVFRRMDACLPWPVPEECHPALDLAGFDPLGELSRFTLQVTGLPDGEYEVLIDGESAGVFHSLQLEQGQNFTLAPGPVQSQMKELLALVIEKNALSVAWNNEVRLYQPPPWFISAEPGSRSAEEDKAAALLESRRAAEAARIEAQIRQIEERIGPLRKPVLRTWRVAPVAPEGGEF